MSRELSDAEYTQAVSLCRSVVEAAGSDDGGPMVAGHFLGRLRDLLPARPESPQDHPASPVSGTRTSADGCSAPSDDLSGQKRAVPPMWWSPSEREWFSTGAETGLHSLGAFVSRAESLPSDAVRLVPVGPLLALAEEWEGLAVECDARVNAAGWSLYRTHARRLRSLLGESPESTNRQEGGND